VCRIVALDGTGGALRTACHDRVNSEAFTLVCAFRYFTSRLRGWHSHHLVLYPSGTQGMAEQTLQRSFLGHAAGLFQRRGSMADIRSAAEGCAYHRGQCRHPRLADRADHDENSIQKLRCCPELLLNSVPEVALSQAVCGRRLPQAGRVR